MNEFDRNPRIVSAAPSADEPSQPDKPVPFHHGLIGRLRSYFLTGWSWLRAAEIRFCL
jgi:hypothetical protein